MAKLAVSKPDDTIQYINIADPNATTVLPEETFNNFMENEGTIKEILDVDGGTINDPGYVDLSGLTALKNVQPQKPGSFYHESVQVTFTDEEKANLQSLIAKLASVAHTHSVSSSESTDATYYSCDNQRCTYCVYHSDNSNNSNNGDNGWYW